MKFNLHSKTHQGLVLILAIAVVMAWCGKLSLELADVLKYVGGGFMGVRSVAGIVDAVRGRECKPEK